jgi:hypothetical protein
VLPNEVITGILIFGGDPILDSCPAADINGNGTVLPNEIITAIFNFGEGCPSE